MLLTMRREVIAVRKGSIIFGTFDGLHKGHFEVLRQAELPATVITFPYPPAMEEEKELLLSPLLKKNRLLENGFSVRILDFSKVSHIEAEDFLEKMDAEYKPKIMCCGFNYRFGHCGKGNAALIKRFCEERGIEAKILPVVEQDGVRISSSFIRDLIKRGEVEKANKLLTRPFSISGEVLHGDSRGRTIGHPTVNFFYPEEIVKARHGVYAAACSIEGKRYTAVTYVGNRPTYELDRCIVETNLLGFSGDLYGKHIEIELLSFLREEKKFDSLDQLKAQIESDIASAQQKNT